MNKKILVAVTSALYGAALGAVASTAPLLNEGNIQLKLQSSQAKTVKSFVRTRLSNKIHVEEALSGKYNYIVRLVDAPLASYRGGIADYKATSPSFSKSFKERNILAKGKSSAAKRNSLKLDFNSTPVKRYTSYLAQKQSDFLSKAGQTLGTQIKPISQMKTAFNGVILSLTQDEAIQLAKLSSVAYVEREQLFTIETDTGPTLVGAPNVWDGSATGVGAQGEGTIIGVIDTGINSDHPSFADVGGDGYDHTNPWGTGVYVGDCANGFAELCNDKLIGIHSYTQITDHFNDTSVYGTNPPAANGEDYNGHGSHTAGTAGGNIIVDAPLLEAESGREEGDGINRTGFTFEQVSGVAPHANIIAYQICDPGNNGDTYSGCPTGPILQAIEDATNEGVDVINYSISGGGFPWNSSTELAYLAAQDAGVFVATSAGNSGPDAFTTSKHAPWYTSVAASTHGRSIVNNLTFNGEDIVYRTSSGPALTASITAPVIYSGHVEEANFEGCAAFADSFFTDSIALISRGSCSFASKIDNATAAGATAVIIFNNTDGDVAIGIGGAESTTIPSVGISQNNGAVMVDALAANAGLEATINLELSRVIGQADDIAGFSSRGPNGTVADIMAPSVAAPGVSIYAAYADQQFGHDVTGPSPSDYAFLQGTSMASPHVAGAGALLKSAHPTWSPDNIRSALMLTATPDMRKEDGTTPADIYDMGSGRIRVDMAAKTGLLMDETEANYMTANPNDGGDPKTLNIPSMGNTACKGTCSWERTFTATKDGTWSASTTSHVSGVELSVSPATFSILEGETQTITVTATTAGLRTGDQATGVITLDSSVEGVPDANLPVFITVNTSNIPPRIDMEVNRDAGSVVLRNNLAIEISEFAPRVFGLAKANSTSLSAGQDSDNSSAFDDLADGVSLSWLTLENASEFLYVKINGATSPDFDLFVGVDTNGDGVPDGSPDGDELLCTAATGATNELCEIEEVEAGNYWIVVQNYDASAVDAIDTFELATAYVPTTSSENFSLSAQQSTDEFTPFDIRVGWNDDMQEGDVFVGAFDIATDASDANAGNLGSTIVVLTRGKDDVRMTTDNENPAVGDKVGFTVYVDANMTDEDANYTLDVNIPDGIEINPDSIVASQGNASLISAGIEGSNISWGGLREGLLGVEPSYLVTDSVTDASCSVPDIGQGGGYIDLARFGFPIQALDGDNALGTVNVQTSFLGTEYPSFTVSDDGIMSFTNDIGPNAFINQLLPSADAPNGLVAPFWRDMQFDNASGSGISLFAGGPWLVVEWDDMRHYAFYNIDPGFDDVVDFEVVMNRDTGEIWYAYDNVAHNAGDFLGQTVGWENPTGTSGANYIFSADVWGAGPGGDPISSVNEIRSGMTICHRLQDVDSSPVTITFSGTITDASAGAGLVATLTSDSTNIGAQEETSQLVTQVQSNLNVSQIDGATIAEEGTLSGVVVEFTDRDSVDNTITVTSENGVASNISGHTSGSTFDITANENFNGEMLVTVTVTDNEKAADSVSTTFAVTVTPVNDAPTATSSARQSFSNGVSTVTLTATGADVDGDDLTYSWVQTSGPGVTISNASSAVATVANANEEAGTLGFEVTISDGELSATSSVTIDVPEKPDLSSGSGSMAWLLMLLISAFGIRRIR